MSPAKTTATQQNNIPRYAREMANTGLDDSFIDEVAKLATQEQGAYDLMELWVESEDDVRNDIVADLKEAVEEFARAG